MGLRVLGVFSAVFAGAQNLNDRLAEIGERLATIQEKVGNIEAPEEKRLGDPPANGEASADEAQPTAARFRAADGVGASGAPLVSFLTPGSTAAVLLANDAGRGSGRGCRVLRRAARTSGPRERERWKAPAGSGAGVRMRRMQTESRCSYASASVASRDGHAATWSRSDSRLWIVAWSRLTSSREAT